MSSYRFAGWEQATVPVKTNEYPGIATPRDLYDRLSAGGWSMETCAPRLREKWSEENKTCGQCSITAFLVQDLFGGQVYGVPLPDGNFHCYNVVDGHTFDLTSEQFREHLNYRDNPEQFRQVHFAKEEKRQRYELLKRKLLALCQGK